MLVKLINIIKIFQRAYFFVLNKFLFKIQAVDIKNNFQINGLLSYSGKGKIKIGENFKANSGRRFNPIGGDTILRFVVKNNAIVEIGDNVGISNSTIVCWNKVTIGNNVLIGGGCKIWDTDFHSLKPELRLKNNDSDATIRSIRICDNVFVGGSSLILKGVTIGENSIIAAGSVLSKSVPANEVWGGNPAKFIKKNL